MISVCFAGLPLLPQMLPWFRLSGSFVAAILVLQIRDFLASFLPSDEWSSIIQISGEFSIIGFIGYHGIDLRLITPILVVYFNAVHVLLCSGYTRKNAQVVTNLQASCNKSAIKPLQHLFALLFPNCCNKLLTSCQQLGTSSAKHLVNGLTTCCYKMWDFYLCTRLNLIATVVSTNNAGHFPLQTYRSVENVHGNGRILIWTWLNIFGKKVRKRIDRRPCQHLEESKRLFCMMGGCWCRPVSSIYTADSVWPWNNLRSQSTLVYSKLTVSNGKWQCW